MKFVWKCVCVITGAVRKSQHRYLLLISMFLSHSCPKVIILCTRRRPQCSPECQRRPGQVNITTGQTSAQILSKDHEKQTSPLHRLLWPAVNVSGQELLGPQCSFIMLTVTVKPVVHYWLNCSPAGQTTTSPPTKWLRDVSWFSSSRSWMK